MAVDTTNYHIQICHHVPAMAMAAAALPLFSLCNCKLNVSDTDVCARSLHPWFKVCSVSSRRRLHSSCTRSSQSEEGDDLVLAFKRNRLESGSSTSNMASELPCRLERDRWSGSRREALLSVAIASVLVSSAGDALAEEAENVAVPNLELYCDEKEGFKLLRPAQWNRVEKAGATVLFEDPATRGNTIGVVVNPVRLSTLKDFGSPDVVAEKLIAAERRKPSTNDATLVRVQERQANGNTPLYALEYTLDSSRGKKRILSAVTVASRKLYILNIAYVDSSATPAPPSLAEVFHQVLNSFDLLS